MGKKEHHEKAKQDPNVLEEGTGAQIRYTFPVVFLVCGNVVWPFLDDFEGSGTLKQQILADAWPEPTKWPKKHQKRPDVSQKHGVPQAEVPQIFQKQTVKMP